LELYGLFRALNATKLWLIGAKELVVEVDTQYIKGMLNKPDLHPNTTMNQWIAAILMFDFELVHVPGAKHKGPDGLSRRRVAESEEEGEGVEEVEEWVDEVIDCGIWVASWLEREGEILVLAVGKRGVDDKDITLERKGKGNRSSEWKEFMQLGIKDEGTKKREAELREIERFLETLKVPEKLTRKDKQRFLQHTGKFFLQGGKMWWREHQGRHQQVIEEQEKCYQLLIEAHD